MKIVSIPAAVGAAVTLAVPILGATSASAATGPACNSSAVGNLCQVRDSWRDYHASFTNGKTARSGLQFKLTCSDGTYYWDQGAFTAKAGTNYTYVFDMHGRNHGTCYTQLVQNNRTVLLQTDAQG